MSTKNKPNQLFYYTNSRVNYYIGLGMINYKMTELEYIESLIQRGYDCFIQRAKCEDKDTVIKSFEDAQKFFNRDFEKNKKRRVQVNSELYTILKVFFNKQKEIKFLSMLICYALLRDWKYKK